MKIEFIKMKFKYALVILVVTFLPNVVNAQNYLDKITGLNSTTASVAYSLRQLSSSYSGPLVRVKVGASFYDVYPDVSTTKFSLSSKISAAIGTYNAAVSAASDNALSSIISGSTDATVAIWYDQSGNGVHVSSNTSTAKIITAGSINTLSGQPTVYFSGNNSKLGSSSTVDYSAFSGATVNAVAQNTATTSGYAGIIGAATAGTYPGYNISYTSGVGYQSDGDGCGYRTSVNSIDPKIVTNIFINNTTNLSKIYVNNELKTNVAVTSGTCALSHTSGSKIFIGVSRGLGSTSTFIGNISEAIIFPSQLSDAIRNPLETNQTQTYFAPSVTITSSATGTVCSGTNVTFTANIYNFTGTPTYQWYKNGTAINGATSSTYSSTTLSNNDQINVSCATETTLVSDATLALLLDAKNGTSISGNTWSDLSGKGKHATLSSDQSYTSGDGGAIQFNGGQNAVSIPLVSNKTTDITMQTWVYLDANTKGPFFKNGTNNGYVFGTGSGGNAFDVGNKATMLFAGTRWIQATNTSYGYGWKLVTMVINSSGVPSMYINNILVPGTYTGTSAAVPTTGTYLGRNVGDDDANWPKFNGKMGAAYFYTKALSLEEITQNFNATAARYGISSSSSISSNTIIASISAPQVTITSSASGAVCAGTVITFTATVCGISTPTYQWTKNGATIPGATSSTYTTTTLSNNDQIQVYVNGGINSANIVSNGLKLNLDASNPGSYAGAGTTWYDLSGNNNHATLNNSPTYEAASGSIVTNGTSQYLSVPLFNNSVTNVTMQAWVYINTPSKGVFIANGYGNGYNVGIGNSGFDSEGSNASMLFSGSRWMFNTNTYTAGWHLVTMVLNGSSTPFIYVDNVLKGSSTGYPGTAPNTPTGYLTLGAIPGDNGRYYAGKFAAAYFYDRVLTLSEITQNYNAFSTKSTAYSSNTITISISGSIPAIEIIGDACVNKTTLSTNSGLTSYAWYKDDVIISGATSNTFTPTYSGSYKVQVTSGSCSSSSSVTNITNCSVASDGSMKAISNSNSIISPEGGANFGTGRDYAGKLYNTTGITTTSGTIGSSTAVLGGIISPTNNVTTSIGVIYSTDINFGTYSSTTIQSNVAAGTYSSTITGLTSSTNYHAKSFIVNKAGTSYGTVVSFTTTTPPPVLGASYGGGNVAHIFTSGDPGYVAGEYHGIIISSVWMNDGVGTSWSSNLTQTNATSLIYGGGLTNTNTIYSLLGTNAYAVNLCKTYSVTQNGITYSDWVLPSLNELLRIATNLTGNGFGTIWTSNRCSNCNWSWSSSELASSSTEVQVMDNGNLGTFGLIKSESGGNRVIVRAIRYF